MDLSRSLEVVYGGGSRDPLIFKEANDCLNRWASSREAWQLCLARISGPDWSSLAPNEQFFISHTLRHKLRGDCAQLGTATAAMETLEYSYRVLTSRVFAGDFANLPKPCVSQLCASLACCMLQLLMLSEASRNVQEAVRSMLSSFLAQYGNIAIFRPFVCLVLKNLADECVSGDLIPFHGAVMYQLWDATTVALHECSHLVWDELMRGAESESRMEHTERIANMEHEYDALCSWVAFDDVSYFTLTKTSMRCLSQLIERAIVVGRSLPFASAFVCDSLECLARLRSRMSSDFIALADEAVVSGLCKCRDAPSSSLMLACADFLSPSMVDSMSEPFVARVLDMVLASLRSRHESADTHMRALRIIEHIASDVRERLTSSVAESNRGVAVVAAREAFFVKCLVGVTDLHLELQEQSISDTDQETMQLMASCLHCARGVVLSIPPLTALNELGSRLRSLERRAGFVVDCLRMGWRSFAGVSQGDARVQNSVTDSAMQAIASMVSHAAEAPIPTDTINEAGLYWLLDLKIACLRFLAVCSRLATRDVSYVDESRVQLICMDALDAVLKLEPGNSHVSFFSEAVAKLLCDLAKRSGGTTACPVSLEVSSRCVKLLHVSHQRLSRKTCDILAEATVSFACRLSSDSDFAQVMVSSLISPLVEFMSNGVAGGTWTTELQSAVDMTTSLYQNSRLGLLPINRRSLVARQVSESMWPRVISPLLDFSGSSVCLERTCRLMKHVIRSDPSEVLRRVGLAYVQKLRSGFRQTGCASCLYGIEVVVGEFAFTLEAEVGSDVRASLEKELEAALIDITTLGFDRLSVLTSAVSTTQGSQDLLEDFASDLFGVLLKYMKTLPSAFGFASNPSALNRVLTSVRSALNTLTGYESIGAGTSVIECIFSKCMVLPNTLAGTLQSAAATSLVLMTKDTFAWLVTHVIMSRSRFLLESIPYLLMTVLSTASRVGCSYEILLASCTPLPAFVSMNDLTTFLNLVVQSSDKSGSEREESLECATRSFARHCEILSRNVDQSH